MLSLVAYHLLNVIVESELSAHELRLGLLRPALSDAAVDRVLHESLRELVEGGFVVWAHHPHYGEGSRPENTPGDREKLDLAWASCFASQGPRGYCPTRDAPGALVFEGTELGTRETFAPCYDAYLSELRARFDWD